MKDNATLADFTASGLVVPHLQGQDPPAVIQELSHALAEEGRVPGSLTFCQAVLQREALVSTEMDGSMAFPHARLAALQELSFALGRSDNPMRWGANSIAKVRLIFLIAVPETATAHYLQLISGLARLSKDDRLRQMLLTASDAGQVMAALGQIALRDPERSQFRSSK